LTSDPASDIQLLPTPLSHPSSVTIVSGTTKPVMISIITPSYNQGRFIRDCIESVRQNAAQTAVQVEHIVVDACSTDETVKILMETPNLKWTSEPDHGQTDAINKGFSQASGDWLMWLNADDYLLPGALAHVSKYALNNPEADIIYGDCIFVDCMKRVQREKREGGFNFYMFLFYGCYIPSTSSFFRRRLIDRGLWLDPNYKNCMDFDYFLRLAIAGAQFHHIPELLAAFRWHDSNASTTFVNRRREERLKVQREVLKLKGLEFIAHPIFLKPAFRLYQTKRAIRRAIGLTP